MYEDVWEELMEEKEPNYEDLECRIRTVIDNQTEEEILKNWIPYDIEK